MPIQHEAKPKKRTKYRPVQRPDGVIVLQRLYRPQAQSHKFEQHLPTFDMPTTTTKPRTSAAIKRTEEDLACMGAQFTEQGRIEYNDPVDAGRGGYNDVADGSKDILDFLKGFSKHGQSSRVSPMLRFLDGAGPWSPFGMEES
ncbi:hypothetical protein CC86DRAFT_409634 [Ophiobolus disseminans]|uniref:Uncharacterized protein n=1 Tax=Ophiobolus disseminans TaxID=1469910 RepID=A0A6A6ZPW6_9PLEO|nr:hypothetical protein CC86DRAFT_409634 [Ophiobolus disseminans]